VSKEKRQDAVEQQHAQTPVKDVIQPQTDVKDYAGTEANSNIEELRQRHLDAYQERERQDFAKAQTVATDLLAELESNGFNPSRGDLDRLSTADGIEDSVSYDHYQHLHNSESQSTGTNEAGGKKSANEHARSHEIKKGK